MYSFQGRVLNLQIRDRVPRARSFQAGLPNMVPTRMSPRSIVPDRLSSSRMVPSRRDPSSVVPARMSPSSTVQARMSQNRMVPSRRDQNSVVTSRRDPRLVTVVRSRDLPGIIQQTSSALTGSQSIPTTSQNTMLSSICPSPRSVRCFSWPRNQDTRRAYVCDGGCRGRTCPVPCECSCVDPRLIGRLRAAGRISGPELRLIDSRVFDSVRRQQSRGRILTVRPSTQSGTQSQRGTNTNNGRRTNELNRSRDTLPDLSFGISDDVLATLIAQPALNEIVGPQGINQILAGEPPPLLSRDNRRQGSPSSSVLSNTVSQPESGTSSVRAQPRADNSVQDQNMGIPVPLSRLNFDPITQVDSASGLSVGK